MAFRIRSSHLAGAILALTPALALAQGLDPRNSPLMFVFAGMGVLLFVLGVIGVVFHFTHRTERARFELIERLLAKGQRVPPELLHRINELPPDARRRRDFRRGVVLLAWGLGVGLVFYILSGGQLRAAAWSLLFLFLSAASFVNWYFADRLEGQPEHTHGG